MQPDTFAYLLTPPAQALLAELAGTAITPDNHLALAAALRRQVPADAAQAILETAWLRQRAAAKFSRAAAMYFTRAALEQASAEVVSRYRSGRYAGHGFEHIADLGCGIGGDALALAAAAPVLGIDRDPLRLAMARENVGAYGYRDRFLPVLADLEELGPLPAAALFADPSRRDAQGRRYRRPADYHPSLATIEAWRARVPHQGIKLSPAVAYDDLPPGAEVEFISVEGEVREAVLWSGALHSGANRRATLLPETATLTDEAVPAAPVAAPRAFLYEPDGAVIRAHLVQQLAARLDAALLDPHIAYLTAHAPHESPFARCFSLEATMPFQLKELRAYLRAGGVGRVTIKKRGSPLDPDRLRQQLRLSGDEERTVFLTRVGDRPLVLIGRPWPGGREANGPPEAGR